MNETVNGPPRANDKQILCGTTLVQLPRIRVSNYEIFNDYSEA